MEKIQKNLFKLKKITLILTIKFYLAKKNYKLATSRIKEALNNYSNDLDVLDLAQRIYVESMNWADYESLQNHLTSLFPNSLAHKKHWGSVLVATGRYEDALSKLTYCVENWNLDSSFSHALANVYARLAICYAYLENWEMVDRCLNQSSKDGIWDPDISYARLLRYLGTGNAEEIQDFLNAQIDNHPSLHALYYWKAIHLHDYLHDVAGSIDWYAAAINKASSLQSRERYWKFYLSTLEYSTPGNILKGAVAACVEQKQNLRALYLIFVAKFLIQDSDISISRFTVYLDILQNSVAKAEKKCRKMLKRRLSVPERFEYLSLLARVQIKQLRYTEADLTLTEALSFNSEDVDIWKALGFCRFQVRNWKSAIEIYQRVLKIDPFDFKSWAILGDCYLNTLDLMQAINSYEKALKLNSAEAEVWIRLGGIYEKVGNTNQAIVAYKNSLKYDWLDPDKRQYALRKLEQINSV